MGKKYCSPSSIYFSLSGVKQWVVIDIPLSSQMLKKTSSGWACCVPRHSCFDACTRITLQINCVQEVFIRKA